MVSILVIKLFPSLSFLSSNFAPQSTPQIVLKSGSIIFFMVKQLMLNNFGVATNFTYLLIQVVCNN